MEYFKYETGGKKVRNSLVYDASFNDDSLSLKYINYFWFKRELDGIELISKKTYSPTIIDVNSETLSITIRHGLNLNHGLYQGGLPQDWKQQVLYVVQDLEDSNIYKFNLYPHTFMFVENQIKLIDMYACAAEYERIKYNDIKDVIRPDSEKRFSFLNNGFLNLKEIYNYGKKNNVGDWPEDFLNG